MTRLLLTLLVSFVPLANADYASCILENMKGVGSDVAAEEIKEACRAKYEQKEEVSFTSADAPLKTQLSPEEYLVNFKTAHGTAVAFANTASTTDAMRAVELTLAMFAVDLPKTEEDDALAESLIELLKDLNHVWLKSDFPESFRGEDYYFGYCARDSLVKDKDSGEQYCVHRPLVKEQFCEPKSESMGLDRLPKKFKAISSRTEIAPNRLWLIQYKVELARSGGYSFKITSDEPMWKTHLEAVCFGLSLPSED